MQPSIQNAQKILHFKEGKVPFILRFIKEVVLEPGTTIIPNNGDSTVLYDERKYTHYDESTGIFSSESDSVSDG
jgi:hypothetical protein